MSVLFYAGIDDRGPADRLLEVAEAKASGNRIEVFNDIGGLSGRVRQLQKGIDVAILLVDSFFRLVEVVELKEYLDGIPVILILPDSEKDTLAKAFKLFPIFLSMIDSDLDMVGAVLENLATIRKRKWENGMIEPRN